MKKLLSITLVILLAFTLMACGEEEVKEAVREAVVTETPRPATPSVETPPVTAPEVNTSSGTVDNGGEGNGNTTDASGVGGGEAMASLISWMMDGSYSYDYTMTMSGPDGSYEGTGSIAVDGDRMAQSQEMTVEGMAVKNRTVFKDDRMYTIDDVNKMVIIMAMEMDSLEGMVSDYTGIELIGTGVGEIDGKTLPYEEYREGDLDATIKYFLDDGEVYGMTTEFDDYLTVMIIHNPSNRAPSGAFDIPSDYMTMDMTDMGGFDFSGLDLSGFEF